MKLILENIGKIKKAEIDLNHQLTVFFGPNNTGKTYVSYCLYGLSKRPPFITVLNEPDKFINIDFDGLYSKGNLEVDLIKLFLPIREQLRRDYITGFKNYLPQLFGNYSSDQFVNSFVSISIFEDDYAFKDYLTNSKFHLIGASFGGRKGSVRFEKEGATLHLKLTENFETVFETGFTKNQVTNSLKRNIIEAFSFAISNAFFIPAERIGISVFGNDLILNRFSQTNSPESTNGFTPYSVAIFDAIGRQFQMANLKGRKSGEKCSALATEIETQILGGNLSVNEAGEVFYGYDEKKVLSILNSASTIKSLSSLVFYLRYFAREGETLFIDEPEINLYPDNQIKIARILAKISNLGIKVYVSTHSDYIMREFNNLMMLGKDAPEKERLMGEYGYKQDEILNHKNVGSYLFKTDGIVESVEVKETGMEMKGIDDTINNQNRASNDIMWTLFDE